VLSVGTLAQPSVDRAFDEKRFAVTLALDSDDADLRPEMTARVDLLVEHKESALLLPVNAVQERAGVLIVEVVHSWGIETRPVEVGASSDIDIEVTRGLSDGEQVLLTARSPAGAGHDPLPAAASPRRQ
jgi:multidrug efflux pump subunit AcrA (membrane-fusion protein)